MSARVSKLASGITVVTDAMPHLQTASLGIWVAAGSRHEDAGENGVSHLLEHMAFKGTARRSARQIAEEIEAVGGDHNASTGFEVTGFYARVLGENVPLALDILADILTAPAFDAGELVREQNVIVQEIGAANDTPEDLVYELFQKRAFPDQPLGRPILGTPQTVRAQSPASLRGYMSRHYRGPRMVLAAAGAVAHEKVLDEAARRLGPVAAGGNSAALPARYAGGLEIGVRDLEQAHVVLGLEGRSFHAPDFFAVQVFANVVGGGSSSRLFQEVREKRGLCYSIYAFHSTYADTGTFGIYAGSDPADSGELVDVVVAELAAAAAAADAAEVERAKAMMKVSQLMALESSGARANQLAHQIIVYGRPIPLEEVVKKIDAVTVEDVRAAGKSLLAGGRPTFAGLGPRAGIESAARIAENLGRAA
jgi:predicted Zn-dependent peptidase